MPNYEIQPAAEFQALPLEFIIASPLIGAIKAQAAAAATTRSFIEALIDPQTKKPISIEFNAKTQQTDGQNTTSKDVTINAPLLSIVPVPHLRIDSITTNFKYEITQVFKEEKSLDTGLTLEAGTTGILSKFVSASLKGNVSSRSAESSTTNRSGMLEITVHASEAPMPEGLAKMLNLLSNSIGIKDNT